MSTDRDVLLGELDRSQWMALSVLADHDTDAERAAYALGWRWLAKEQRWPVRVKRQDDDDVPGPDGWMWEWWRENEDRVFSCSLPPLLMEHVRKRSRAVKGRTCRFPTVSAALACAAYCAGVLIQATGSLE